MAFTSMADRLAIHTVSVGIYKGFNPIVAAMTKIAILLLAVILILYPDSASSITKSLRDATLSYFARWYVYLFGALMVTSIGLVFLPGSGRIVLGRRGDIPEYSTKSWLAMMFCAGIGVGILVFSVSEPISHFSTNPEIISGVIPAASTEAITSAMRFTFLHWGFSAWGCYAVIGLALGLACHTHGQPLTMRSALVPLFGTRMKGSLGHLVDIVSILTIIAGITTTVILGLEQICSGLSLLTGSSFFADHAGDPPLTALLTALVAAIAIATTSIVSGVDRGVKWISNAGVMAAFGVLLVFILVGPDTRLFAIFADSTFAYLRTLPEQIFTVYHGDPSSIGSSQARWQGDWTIFYWAWWISFAPFVGLFLARISRGRTVREFILGAMIGPTAICFVWFSVIGGSALLLEADGTAQGRIIAASHASKIYETVTLTFAPDFTKIIIFVITALFLLLIVASSSAAIIAIKSIGAAGRDIPETRLHSMVWAIVIAAIAGAVMSVDGVQSVRDLMIIGAVPFSGIMALMLISVIRLIWNEYVGLPLANKAGFRT